MKVKELKEIIENVHDDLDIIVSEYEGGWITVTTVKQSEIVWNYDTKRSYCGPHEVKEEGTYDTPEPGSEDRIALVVY